MRIEEFSYTTRIVIDLDNTLVAYDELFGAVARERDLISSGVSCTKHSVREAVRRRPNGERDWRELQADVYGELIARAPAFPGSREFIARVRECKGHVAIVSHKTPFAAARPGGPNLRDAALRWLEANNMLGFGAVAERDVYFESSRPEKVARICALDADIAIDDLVEVLNDELFPARTRRWLFAPSGVTEQSSRLECFEDWAAMQSAFEGCTCRSVQPIR